MARIVIIGAGLTGISTAYHLENAGFSDYIIVEKEKTPGGLCRSIEHDGFIFDYTGHLLHASDDYFYQLIQEIVGLDRMNVIDRRSYIYSHETYTNYPFQINLHGLPPAVIVACISEFVERTPNPNPRTFREWVLANFGKGLGDHFFFPYQEKIFAHDIDDLTASWTGRFVPPTSLRAMLAGALGSTAQPIGYNARFLYPHAGGIYSWIAPFAKAVRKEILLEHEVTAIDMRKKIVRFKNGNSEPYELLVSTMPLNYCLDAIDETPAVALKQAQSQLKCNSVINFNLGINRPDLSDKHWIYFPEKKYPFYRLGFWHNFSPNMAPAGMSSLYGEFAHMQAPREQVQELLDQSLAAVKKLFAISDTDIVTQKVISIAHAYVTYDHWRERNLPALLEQLMRHNIYSVGRYGAWKYASMQEAVLDGKETAQQLLEKLKELPHDQETIQRQHSAHHHASPHGL